MKKTKTLFSHCAWLVILAVAGLCFCGCSDSPNADYDDEFIPSVRPKPEKDGVFASRGSGKFVYTKYAPLANKPVTVNYYIPKSGTVAEMPVLFAMHGAERTATAQLNAWTNLAETYGFILIAPEFFKPEDVLDGDGYTENDYQFGGVFESKTSTTVRPENQWTYQLIEEIFDYLKAETDNTSATYNMFGHSAGGQFVHRFLWAMPKARVNRAVAANPGSLTFPLKDGLKGTDNKIYGWPYSIYKSPFADDEHMKSFFSRQLFIQTGTADVDTADSSFPKDAASMGQGGTRHERAHVFYDACVEQAKAMGITLKVKIADVQGAGHSTPQMVYGLPSPNTAKPETRGTNNAYDLIFN